MAKAPTEEQSQLRRRARRRLVGSIALVTIVAVILPWVLEDEPSPADQQIAIQIPSPDAGKFEPKAPSSKAAPAAPEPAAPAGEKPPAAAPAAGASAPSAQADDALRSEQAKVLAPPVKAPPPPPKAAPKDKEPVPKDREAAQKEREAKERAAAAEARKKPAEKSETAAEAKPAEGKPAEAKAADARPYVVQVVALADAEKAAEVQKAMAAKGLKVYTEKVKTSSGEVTRVRVGPFPNRDAAEKERARMKALGFDGSVLPR